MNASEALIHDLRAPLQLIAGYAEMLEMEFAGNARAGEYVRLLAESAAEMRAMLENALESDRTEARACAESVDLVRHTREICARYRLSAARRGVRLTLSTNTAALPMQLEPEKYARILANLLSNALKYTPSGGRVAISLIAEESSVRVAVADDGCGIEPERLAHIFNPGETDCGYGLGLAIARDYAKRMCGALEAVSVPGKGSAFTLTLPLQAFA